MRADGTRTPVEKRKALAEIESQITAVDAALAALAEHTNRRPLAPVRETVGTAWNALHDALTDLREEFRQVEMNRPLVLSGTALLIAQNID